MRGYMYELSTRKDLLFELDSDDLLSYLNQLGDYVSLLDNQKRVSAENEFLCAMKKIGATTEKETLEEESWKELHYVILNEEAKRNYFGKRFEQLKKAVENMSIDDFALHDVYDLKQIVENNYSECVYIDDNWHTLDAFIREARIGEKYYIGNIVLIH